MLLVEDVKTDLLVIQSIMKDIADDPFEMIHAANLNAAKERLAKGDIDVVLTDLGLPDSAGLDTFKELQADFPTVPIVVLTGADSPEQAREAVSLGAQDYLEKWNIDSRMMERTLLHAIERKQLQSELRALNETLEERVRQRTQDLTRSNAELEKYAYIVAHDLRAPVRGIKSLADWLKADCVDVLEAEHLNNLTLLQNRAHRMGDLIDGLLEYVRVERETTTMQTTNCNDIVHSAVKILDPDDHISVNVQASLPEVVFDMEQLERLFRSLIENAIQHNGRDQCEITVSHRETDKFWEFCVRDDGVGIPVSQQERVFDMFQTLKPRDELETVGLGLTVARGIVERYGGSIRVESIEDQGSAFFFTIPLDLAFGRSRSKLAGEENDG
jgi:signal transduction histidine kinase